MSDHVIAWIDLPLEIRRIIYEADEDWTKLELGAVYRNEADHDGETDSDDDEDGEYSDDNDDEADAEDDGDDDSSTGSDDAIETKCPELKLHLALWKPTGLTMTSKAVRRGVLATVPTRQWKAGKLVLEVTAVIKASYDSRKRPFIKMQLSEKTIDFLSLPTDNPLEFQSVPTDIGEYAKLLLRWTGTRVEILEITCEDELQNEEDDPKGTRGERCWELQHFSLPLPLTRSVKDRSGRGISMVGVKRALEIINVKAYREYLDFTGRRSREFTYEEVVEEMQQTVVKPNRNKLTI
ncbi:Hypothetical protein D9617_35g089710 [Elsinoe fawcettii]|nr:Hypothetical protein D9617_35g089710 [Elsinoe fawcettii]